MVYIDSSRFVGRLIATIIILLVFLFGAILILSGESPKGKFTCDDFGSTCSVTCQEKTVHLSFLDKSCTQETPLCCRRLGF